MALFNPLRLLVLPFVFLVALPLALFAGLTTMLAFFVLFLRLFLVYLDVGLEAIRNILLGRSLGPGASTSPRQHAQSPMHMTASSSSSLSSLSAGADVPSTPRASSRYYRRSRRGSSSSNSNHGNTGSGALTPIANMGAGSFDGLALTPSLGLERDFEGVGGWRLDSLNGDTDPNSDQQWFNLNARLQVPDRHGGSVANGGASKHHYRSQSGGPVLAGGGNGLGWSTGRGGGGGAPVSGNRYMPPSPEGLRMTVSPNSSRSRSRTPKASMPQGLARADQNEYFLQYDVKSEKNVCV